MLSSIHPFGERSRNNEFWLTSSAHIIGSAAGGAFLGLLAGSLGWLTTLVWDADSAARSVVLGVSAAIATLLEATGRERRLPTRTRQVDENWIQSYRGWVYGGGFGAELGFGVSTIITTSLIHVLVLSMVLIGSIPAALVLGAVFGAVRGGTVLTAYRVDSPERLRGFHATLDRVRPRSRHAGVAALGLTSLIGLSAAVL